MAIVDSDIREAVKTLVSDLASGRYNKLATDGRIGRLTPDELERVIRDYGRTVVELPDEAWDVADTYPPGAPRSLDVPLWTKEEGRSDLTLSLSVVRSGAGLQIAIDDLHVL